jgi:CubicO group peptidase (beta-lactamase class C family)
MNKRQFLLAIFGLGSSCMTTASFAQDRWGESRGFPTGWGLPGQQQKWEGYSEYHVGNFSGGIESMLAHQKIRASTQPLELKEAKRKIRINLFMDASDFAFKYNRSGLLIARKGEIWHEEYRFKRNADMRFFGWSMTKSIVGLLTGIALEQKKIESVDDRLDKYIPQLVGHQFADITLRNLLNMTSGINICEAFCSPSNGFERYGYSQIGYSPRRGEGTDQIKALLDFKWGRSEPQGAKFNYTDINPVMVAWALETVYQQPLALIAEQQLWQPMGAAADATWLTDAKGFTFSGAGFSATLQDWARLGMLVANDGNLNGRQIVPKSWIEDTARHTDKDQASRFNVARPGRAYKNFFWHHTADGGMLRMAGALSQSVLLDRKTKTILVQTGVSDENGADEMMRTLFASACEQS